MIGSFAIFVFQKAKDHLRLRDFEGISYLLKNDNFHQKIFAFLKTEKIKKWLIELRGKARFFGCFRIETQLNWYVIQQAGELIYRTTANQDDVNSEFFSAF